MPIDSSRRARNKIEKKKKVVAHVTRALPITKGPGTEGGWKRERKSSRLIASRQRKAIAAANGKSRRRDDIGRREEGPRPFIRFTVEQIRTYV